MDIHSNEVKAINNSGGNAYPHLVPFLLKSSVCNKRSSRSLGIERKREERKQRERKREERTSTRCRLKERMEKKDDGGETGGNERSKEREREKKRSRGTGRYAPRNILEYLRNLVAGH